MGDDLKELETISTTLRDLGAKFDDLAVKVDRLVPLAPVATKIAALPEKVVTLQSATFENTMQVRALNLALIRVESAQRDGKAPAQEDVGATEDSINNQRDHGPKPPPRSDPRSGHRHARNPHSDHRRGIASTRRMMTTSTPTSTRASASSSPRSTARRTRFRG